MEKREKEFALLKEAPRRIAKGQLSLNDVREKCGLPTIEDGAADELLVQLD